MKTIPLSNWKKLNGGLMNRNADETKTDAMMSKDGIELLAIDNLEKES